MLKNLKNLEWSKKLLLFTEALIIAVFVLTTVATFKGLVDALVALITGVFSLASISFGFYYWKAKNENIRKYATGLTAETAEKILKIYGVLNHEDD